MLSEPLQPRQPRQPRLIVTDNVTTYVRIVFCNAEELNGISGFASHRHNSITFWTVTIMIWR